MENHEQIAKEARKTVLSMIYKAQVSHIGSNFSCIDILTVLYSKLNPKIDKLVVSKGWVAASVYALNVKYGYMPQEAIDTFCDGKSPYIGLIEPIGYFGCEVASGSMGLGFPAAVGIALAKKLKGEEGKVYVLMSDGEMQCGTTWESALIAEKHELNNLVIIEDRNGFQAMGKVDDILYSGFPRLSFFDYQIIAGHNYNEIEEALKGNLVGLGKIKGNRPYFISCHTIKGKGVSKFEGNNLYHYKNLSEEEYKEALKELNK